MVGTIGGDVEEEITADLEDGAFEADWYSLVAWLSLATWRWVVDDSGRSCGIAGRASAHFDTTSSFWDANLDRAEFNHDKSISLLKSEGRFEERGTKWYGDSRWLLNRYTHTPSNGMNQSCERLDYVYRRKKRP